VAVVMTSVRPRLPATHPPFARWDALMAEAARATAGSREPTPLARRAKTAQAVRETLPPIEPSLA
jgi:hypothetical protein